MVSQHQRALHIVFPHQFLDSPEWFGVSTDDYFQVGVLRQQLHRQQLINQSLRTFVPLRQVSIMAMEESRVLIWHRDKLKLSIMAEPFLQTVFDHILGRDVVKKLMQVTQVSDPGHMCSCIKNFNSERVSDRLLFVIQVFGNRNALSILGERVDSQQWLPALWWIC